MAEEYVQFIDKFGENDTKTDKKIKTILINELVKPLLNNNPKERKLISSIDMKKLLADISKVKKE